MMLVWLGRPVASDDSSPGIGELSAMPEPVAASAEEVRFEQRIVEIDRFATDHPESRREVLDRWETFRAEARGTAYEAYATMSIEQTRDAWERAAGAAIARTREQVLNEVDQWRWDRAVEHLERFPPELRGTRLDAELTGLRETIETHRKRWQGSVVYCHADFRHRGEDFPRSEGFRIRDPRGVVRYQAEAGIPHLKFQNGSRIGFEFPVEQPPRLARLRLRHVSSMLRGGRCYSPVTISINGTILVGNWSPANRSWVSSGIWDVTPYLRRGTNEVVVEYRSGFSQYWLEEIEVSGHP